MKVARASEPVVELSRDSIHGFAEPCYANFDLKGSPGISYNPGMSWKEPISLTQTGCCAAFCLVISVAAFAEATPDSDADLHDVVFVDRQTGWVVGDRGTIWHTADGGANWQLQACPSHDRLSAASFFDATRGWVVASRVRPYVIDGASRILATEDGGQTWTVVKRAQLPYARALRFADDRSGVVLTTPQPHFPSGLFQTTDGGRSWHPLPGTPRSAWTRVDVGPHGRLLLVESQAAVAERELAEPNSGIRTAAVPARLNDGCYLAPGRACIVGDHGTILMLQEQRWLNASVAVPEAFSVIDLKTVVAVGDSIWAAGAPGSVILRSSDGGRSWSATHTGQTLPIHDLCFVDARHGWAVGALGLVMNTTDGGQTWQVRRGAGRRLGALVVAADDRSLPLVLLAQLAAEHRFHTRAIVCGSGADVPSWAEPPLDRLSAATQLVGAGGCELWDEFGFGSPLVAANEQVIAAAWAQHPNGQPGTQPLSQVTLSVRLARAIRQWRPSIVLVAVDCSHGGARRLLQEAIQTAVAEAASDESSLAQPGLPCWQVSRLVLADRAGSVDSAASGSPLTIQPSRIVVDRGKSLGELAAAAQWLLCPRSEPVTTAACRQLNGQPLPRNWIATVRADQSVLQQEKAITGSFARGESPLRKTQQRENVRRLLSRATTGAAAGRLMPLVNELPDELAAQLMLELADQLGRGGQTAEQLQTWAAVAERFAATAAAELALWRQFVASSSEEKQLRQRTHLRRPARVDLLTDPSLMRSADARSQGTVQPASNISASSEEVSTADLLSQAAAHVKASPEWQLAWASAERRRRGGEAAIGMLKRQKRTAPTKAWQLAAAAEVWLADASRRAPRPTWSCPLGARPHLDGRLDDATWQAHQPTSLGPLLPLAHPLATEVFVARDRQCLFLAVRCQKVGGLTYPQNQPPRPRDTRPGQLDRVDFFFDVNRDYHSSWHLGFDCRGFAVDMESGELGWNPAWHVAAAQTATHWTVEAAIPLAELTFEPTELDAWVFGVRRVVPQWGWQVWPPDADVEPACQELGYLMFETTQ